MKRFSWCPLIQLKNCEARYSEPHDHICIRSPGEVVHKPSCGRTALHLEFHDLEPETIRKTGAFADDPEKGQKLIERCMNDVDARGIIAFVERSELDLIVVNCEAGVSRSPAVVLALRTFYGGDVKECCEKAFPNTHVLSTLLYELLRKDFRQRVNFYESP